MSPTRGGRLGVSRAVLTLLLEEEEEEGFSICWKGRRRGRLGAEGPGDRGQEN